jgi:hypothetical protein
MAERRSHRYSNDLANITSMKREPKYNRGNTSGSRLNPIAEGELVINCTVHKLNRHFAGLYFPRSMEYYIYI